MATVIPCIKGSFGNTTYYSSTMKAREFVSTTRAACETDEWASMGLEERMQRDPNLKRIINEISPYLVNNADRFFGSVIVLIYKGEVDFETLNDLRIRLPKAYNIACESLGFLTIDGGILIILDGQNRMLSIKKVIEKEIDGRFADDVLDDEISVLFIVHENNQKTRRIFNKINRTAQKTSKSDNLITSEDDGYAIISRWLLNNDAPLGIKNYENKDIVNWSNNSLSRRNIHLTTLSALYDITKVILDHNKISFDINQRPSQEDLDKAFSIICSYWEYILENIYAYNNAITDFITPSNSRSKSKIVEFREDANSTYTLLFKPAGQLALSKALMYAKEIGLTFDLAIEKINLIDWSYNNPIWRDIIFRSNNSIDASKPAIEKAANLIFYLIAGELMSPNLISDINRIYNESRGNNSNNLEELPDFITVR